MTSKQRANRRQAVLKLALKSCWVGNRREYQEIFDLLRKQGYGVLGYKYHLTETMKYLDRALAAINALEGNQ